MPANRPATEEPRLTVTRPPRRRLRRALASALPVPVIGLVLLVASGNLLQGVFTRAPDVAEGFGLRAEYGEEQPPVSMRVVAPGNARRSIPAGTFTARCLGKMTGWREDTREVTLEAIAIFW
ncbi:hypothetical protein [Streptomyces coeruleorubidus]|uniref:hypothetical protein n=1 Tax=Streptomyces coeruleorubidus TaxID=116188 RepID=UPI0033B23A21